MQPTNAVRNAEQDFAQAQQEALLQAMVQSVTSEDIVAIARALVEKAKRGDLTAARLVLSYVLGKPGSAAKPKGAESKKAAEVVEMAPVKGAEGLERGRSAPLAAPDSNPRKAGLSATAGNVACLQSGFDGDVKGKSATNKGQAGMSPVAGELQPIRALAG